MRFRYCFRRIGLIALFWTFLRLSPGYAAQVVPLIVGDLNGDGKITAADVGRALRLSVGLEKMAANDLQRGDVEPSPGIGPRDGQPLGDGKITVADALTLLRHVVGLPGGPWADPARPASFARIHKEIFLASCATSSCHNANARRAGLNLEDPLQAFALLVNHDPANDAALAAGLKRVTPGHPETSFLVEKLEGPKSDDYGIRMPYGTYALPDDKIALVKEWIAEGATFDLDDGTLKSSDDGPTVDPTAEDVSLPAPPPDKGFQISLDRFPVPYGQEVQRDFFLKTPNTDSHWIKRIDYAYNKGSHHLQIFKADTIDVPDHVDSRFGLSLGPGWNVVMFTQNEAVTTEFPPGVGFFLQPHQQMDFQLHYVNSSSQKTPTGYGKLVANFWYAEPGETTSRAGFLFGSKVGFTLPPLVETTLSRSFVFPEDVKVFALAGHFHSRGKRFRFYRWDGKTKGEIVYESKEWDDPGYQTYDPPLQFQKGTGLMVEAVYFNNFDHIIDEGPYAESQEHLFYFGWFYRDNDLDLKDLFDFGS